MNTGVPHAVVFTDDVEAVEVSKDGAALPLSSRLLPKGNQCEFCSSAIAGLDCDSHLRARRGGRDSRLWHGRVRCGPASPSSHAFTISCSCKGSRRRHASGRVRSIRARCPQCHAHWSGRFCFRRDDFPVVLRHPMSFAGTHTAPGHAVSQRRLRSQRPFAVSLKLRLREALRGSFPLAPPGSLPTLTHEEHTEVIRVAIEAAKGRLQGYRRHGLELHDGGCFPYDGC